MSPQPARSSAQKALWRNLRLVVVDTETTGVTTTSRVVSLAMVEVVNGRFGNSASWLINPGLRKVSQSERHGLDAEALRHEVPFKAVAGELLLRLGSSTGERVVLTGYNTVFDARMLQSELAALNKSLPVLEMLDVADLATHVGVVFQAGLAGLLEALGEHNPAAHTELGDAVSTAKAAIVLLDKLIASGSTDLTPVLVPLNPEALGAPRGRRRDIEPVALSEEHQAAHRQELLDPDERRASLEVCLREHCEALAARMEDGISSPADAVDVAHWAHEHALGTTLDRRLFGRLLTGLGRAAIRAEDPELARLLLLDLAEPLQELGPCTTGDQCGRCLFTDNTCRFDQVRNRLVEAFLLIHADLKPKDRLEYADAFLHLPRVPNRGQPRRGFYAQLREAGEHDAAGYGAHLAASIRRRVPDRDWALRTLERAWEHGSRNPHLADRYASMLVLDRRTRTGSHLTDAVQVCNDALAQRGERQARIWRELEVRRDRLTKLAANPPRTKPKVKPSQVRNRRTSPQQRFSLE